MADKIQFDLVSPERLLMSAAVEMVVIPGAEGDFGVLAGHAPFISTIRPGIIEVHDDGKVTERIFIGSGFVEVVPERCTVLAEDAAPLDQLDRSRIEDEIKILQSDLSEATQEAERAVLTRKIEIAETKLSVATR